jgi:two-component system CheB/CheR fusion protein
MKKKAEQNQTTKQQRASEVQQITAREEKKTAAPKVTPPPRKKKSEPIEQHPSGKKVFPLVGIGASAGGLEPLEAFFAYMPADKPDMAFVVIQHLSPKHKSIIGDILKKDTDMPITEIRNGMKVEPNTIYFNPPDQEVTIHQGTFLLVQPTEARFTRLPIDIFFRSLALELEEKAICIVLSGTGSDGTLGLEAVKGAGGMTMAQAEKQAKYPFMPRSAIDTGLVDFVLTVEKMPEEIIRYLKHPYLEERERELPADQHFQTYLQKVLMLVRANTKHDFSHYKQTTIRRRIGRRMAVHKLENIADYFHYLQRNPGEIQALFKDLVICVTSFFRDLEAFKALETKVVQEIINKKSPDQDIRVWVAGCGSGEEALSIAMLFREAMEKAAKHLSLQIFATDIDKDAIDKARQGEYPESIAADVSPERLQHFFVKKESTYKIKQEIRETVIYAVQNLISDPPFSRLDLISCRNVLIYLDTDLQKQILPLFHFTLNPNGYLFLGSSESIGDAAELFSPLDAKWKIFRRKGPVHHPLADYPALTQLPAAQINIAGEKLPPLEVDPYTLAEKVVLEEYAPPSILINGRYDVLYFLGDSSRFLGMPKGKPAFNLLILTHDPLRPQMLTVLRKALIDKRPVMSKPIAFPKPEGGLGYLHLMVRPLGRPGIEDLYLVVFKELSALPQTKEAKGKGQAAVAAEDEPKVATLERELQATKEYLQTTVEELEASNEELTSTNEELQSTNEELQSTNEELETAKEELQSTNEELVTVNSELINKIDELTEVNNDITNLLSSTEIGTIFLDRDLNIKRFTPAATKLFNLLPLDVGRSIRDITPKTESLDIPKNAAKVLQTLQVKEFEVTNQAGETYAIRILPYRTRNDVIDGVVLTFIDISFQHLLGMAKNLAENIVDTVREPLLVLDGTLKVISANQAFYRTFQTTKEETEFRPIYELGDGQWDIPQLREILEEIIPRDSTFKDFEVERDFPRIGRKTMFLNARCIPAAGENVGLVLLAIEDVTELQRKDSEYQETIDRLEKELAEYKGKGTGR